MNKHDKSLTQKSIDSIAACLSDISLCLIMRDGNLFLWAHRQSNQVPWLWLKAAIVMCVHFKAEPRKFTLSMPQTERFTSINCTAITLRLTIIVHNLCMTFAVFPSLSSRSKNYYISWFSRILNLIKLINYQKENADDEEVTRKFMRWLYDGMIMRTWIFGYKLIQGFICFVTTSTGRRKLFIINSSWKINVFT